MKRLAIAHDLFDRLAIGLSALCLVHCATTVVVVALLASAGGELLHPAIHRVGLGLAMLLALIGLGRGYLDHRKAGPALLGAAGIAAMAIGLTVPHGMVEAAYTITGVSLVATAHFLNRRCQTC